MTTKQPRQKGFGKPSTAGDYHRPRRPSAETVRYLRSLPLELSTSLEEIREFVDPSLSTEFPSSLAAALVALDEIGHEVASLAGDEHASAALELLVRITAPVSAVAARKLLAACAGYAVFLATHRFGSHVLQTILQFAVSSSFALESDLGLHEDAPGMSGVDELPALSEALLLLHAELLPHASQLAVHVCGSHILRTLCCVLGGYHQSVAGVDSTTTTLHQHHHRRGGKSKAKKVDKAAADPRLVAISNSRIDPDDAEQFTQALDELTSAISGSEVQPPGKLQELACDSSASPLVMILLRVLTYREAPPHDNEQDASHSTESTPNPDHHLVLIPKEPHFPKGSPAEALVHRLLCWRPDSDNASQPHAADVIYGLAGEPRGSHVLGTIFRLASDELYECILQLGDFLSPSTLKEYVQHDVSNFVIQNILATIRTSRQAMQISNALQPLSTLILDASQRRRGILWRWAEMAVHYPQCQTIIIQGMTQALEKLQTNSKFSKHFANVLLGIKDSPADSDRLVLNVEGTRALFHLLHFQETDSKGVVESVSSLSTTDLERLAKDGLGSRCVWDAILEDGSPAASLRKKLLTKLQGRWVSVATDRVGHHVVRKLFALSDLNNRENLVLEFAESIARLEGNAMGRKIATQCHVREYMTKGKKEWEGCVGKAVKEKTWLRDIGKPETHTHVKDSKRKSKDERAVTKSKRIKEMSMGDIVSAISMPKK